jgi:hypothetical protein
MSKVKYIGTVEDQGGEYDVFEVDGKQVRYPTSSRVFSYSCSLNALSLILLVLVIIVIVAFAMGSIA